jgi:hypothetical protein
LSKERLSSRRYKLLTSLEFESLLFISQIVQKKTSTDLPFSEIFHQDFANPFSANIRLPLPSSEESFNNQLKSIPELFRSCQVLDQPLVVHYICHLQDFHSCPEILPTIQKPMYERDSTVTLRLFYHLESFSSCFAHLETKFNVHSLFHHYELSQ